MRPDDLPFGMRVELKTLARENADVVAQQLAVALALIDDDPAEAYSYAAAAVKRAGRIAIVREVAGIAAYRSGDWQTALRELRTHRRITGSQLNIALLADAERGLERPADAIALAEETDLTDVPTEVRVELAIVVSGAWRDQGKLAEARKALEIPELDPDTAFSYSGRLFEAYADVLRALEDPEADAWERRAKIAARVWNEHKHGTSGEPKPLVDDEVEVQDLGEILE
ncbi:hypothetical protein F8O09_10365 [Pseudoclavibacter sp. CFCC 11306]|nr:hypothetical protein F8O09_10365 [Pseudoclavibacter sp. CFCC 11306]